MIIFTFKKIIIIAIIILFLGLFAYFFGFSGLLEIATEGSPGAAVPGGL